MKLEELAQKIAEMLTAYNADMAYDEDDRIVTAQLMLARPAERVSRDKPQALFVTPKQFVPEMTEEGKDQAARLSGQSGMVTYAYSPSSSLQCCAVGWMGVVDSHGKFYSCYPIPGSCPTFPGPNRCVVP